jgi:alpha-1,3-rhamnosyltransferase
MDELPRIAVLIASYNHGPWIGEAIESILAQEGVQVELHVIDDGSRDQSPRILQELADQHGFDLLIRPNQGLTATLIELVSRTDAQWFCSLGSDDIMPRGRLRAQWEELERHPNAPGCSGQIIEMDAQSILQPHPLRRFQSGIPEVDFEQLLMAQREIHGASVLIRRNAFDAVGGYNRAIEVEDYPLWLALTRRFGPLRVLPEVVCHYRIHGTNMHLRSNFMYTELLKAVALHQDHPLHSRAVRRWKANWWSELAFNDKTQALRRLFELGSFDPSFLRRLPKLLVPRSWLRQ